MTNANRRTRVYVQTKLLELMDDYTLEEWGQMFRAILEFYVTGAEPDFQDRAMKTVWKSVLPFLQNCNDEWIKTCERNRENGKLGGRPLKHVNNPVGYEKTHMVSVGTHSNPLEPTRTHSNPLKADYDLDSDLDSEKDIGESANVNASTNNHGIDSAFQLELPGLPDGKPAQKVKRKSRKKWTIEEFRSDVLEAGKAFPDFLPEDAEYFIGHFTQMGESDLAFKEIKWWDSAFQIGKWLKRKGEYERAKTVNPATPAKKPDTAEEIRRKNAAEHAEYLRQLADEEKEAANVTTA